MKKILFALVVTLTLVGATSTYTLADGPSPVPTCDPRTRICR